MTLSDFSVNPHSNMNHAYTVRSRPTYERNPTTWVPQAPIRNGRSTPLSPTPKATGFRETSEKLKSGPNLIKNGEHRTLNLDRLIDVRLMIFKITDL